MIAHDPHDPDPDAPPLWAHVLGMAVVLTIMFGGVIQVGQWLVAIVKWFSNGEC